MENKKYSKIKNNKDKVLQLNKVKLVKYSNKKKVLLNSVNNYTYITVNTRYDKNKKYNKLNQGYYSYSIYSYQDGRESEVSNYQGILYSTNFTELNLKGLYYAIQQISEVENLVVELASPLCTNIFLKREVGKKNQNYLKPYKELINNIKHLFNQHKKVLYLFDPNNKSHTKYYFNNNTTLSCFYRDMNFSDKPSRPKVKVNHKDKKEIDIKYQALPLLDFVPTQGIRAYTDGAKRYKKGVGAYGYYLVRPDKKPIEHVEISKQATTSQRQELRGLVKFLKDSHGYKDEMIAVITDSQYIINVFTNQSWLETWCKNGLRRADNKKVKNFDLLIGIIKQLSNYKHVFFAKVKGHSNDEGNNKIDQLLNEAMDSAE